MAKEAKKAELLKAMDVLARSINNEDIVDSWLLGGIPDGTTEDEYIDYVDDIDDIAACFLRCMKRAQEDGGLCY